MIVTPSDHLVLDVDKFRSEMVGCMEFAANSGALLTVGINPTRPFLILLLYQTQHKCLFLTNLTQMPFLKSHLLCQTQHKCLFLKGAYQANKG